MIVRRGREVRVNLGNYESMLCQALVEVSAADLGYSEQEISDDPAGVANHLAEWADSTVSSMLLDDLADARALCNESSSVVMQIVDADTNRRVASADRTRRP